MSRRARRRGEQVLTGRWLPALLLILLAAGAYSQTAPTKSAAPRYELVELPFRPLSISNSEWLAGTTYDQHAATWSARTGLSRIPLPSEFTLSECVSINSRGEAAGNASTADSSRRVAFVLRQGKVAFLTGGQARANSINEEGAIAGQAIL